MPLLIGLVNRAKQIRLLIGLADRGIGLANTRKHLVFLIGSANKGKHVQVQVQLQAQLLWSSETHAAFNRFKGLVDAGSVKEQNTALSFELVKLINHPLKNLKFQGLFLRRKRQTSYCGLCVVYRMVELQYQWCHEKLNNKLVEWKVFIISFRMQNVDFKDIFLFLTFASFSFALVERETMFWP